MGARDIKFPDNSFDLVFSDGLLEYFEDFSPIAKEFCRISKSWVLLFQPNQESLFGRIKSYVKIFSEFGFGQVNSGGINFNEQMWLLFKVIK